MPKPHRNSLSLLNKVLPNPISLEDHTPETQHFLETSHITDVLVGNYHIILGEVGKPYIVWLIKIIVNESPYSSINIYKRYSEIERFRSELVENHKDMEIPPLPAKDSFSFQKMVWSNQWLENRRKGLQWFMTNALLNPQLQHSKIVIQFILSK